MFNTIQIGKIDVTLLQNSCGINSADKIRRWIDNLGEKRYAYIVEWNNNPS
jgi:hypothetical protein